MSVSKKYSLERCRSNLHKPKPSPLGKGDREAVDEVYCIK